RRLLPRAAAHLARRQAGPGGPEEGAPRSVEVEAIEFGDEFGSPAGPVRSVRRALRRLALAEAARGRPPSPRQGSFQRRSRPAAPGVDGAGSVTSCPRKGFLNRFFFH